MSKKVSSTMQRIVDAVRDEEEIAVVGTALAAVLVDLAQYCETPKRDFLAMLSETWDLNEEKVVH